MMNRIIILLLSIGILASCGEDTKPPDEKKYNPTPFEYDVRIPARDFALDIPDDNPMTVEGVRLGKELFSEKLLSADGKLSCSSCHKEEYAFGDNKQFSVGRDGVILESNTMNLFNLAFNRHFGWIGQADRLEKSIHKTIELESEFNEDWDNVVLKLKNGGYKDKFFEAFGTEEISADLTTKAIAQYLRSIVNLNSKFDKIYYFEDENTRFNVQETRGLEIFLSERGDCFHCHRLGPFFDNRFHNNGLDANPSRGREKITSKQSDIGKYKTPSLRNVAITAPYMHDGRFKTLKEVLDFYSDGVQYSETLDPNMNHEGGIELNEQEKEDLIAFLKTLTDERYLD